MHFHITRALGKHETIEKTYRVSIIQLGIILFYFLDMSNVSFESQITLAQSNYLLS